MIRNLYQINWGNTHAISLSNAGKSRSFTAVLQITNFHLVRQSCTPVSATNCKEEGISERCREEIGLSSPKIPLFSYVVGRFVSFCVFVSCSALTTRNFCPDCQWARRKRHLSLRRLENKFHPRKNFRQQSSSRRRENSHPGYTYIYWQNFVLK